MSNVEDVVIPSQQNDGERKAVNVDGHETGKDLICDKISIKSTLGIRKHRWWENCAGAITTSESPIEEEYTRGITSCDAQGSHADEIDKEEKDEEVVTGIMTENVRTESSVPKELEMDTTETVDSKETYHHKQEEKVVCGEMGKSEMETISSILASEKNEELDYEEKKSEAVQIPCQVSRSWEYYGSNKNVFREISEKIKEKCSWEYYAKNKNAFKEIRQKMNSEKMNEKEMEHTAFDDSLDANKIANISNVPLSITYGENLEGGQEAIGEERGDQTIPKGVESFAVTTLELSVQNKDDSLLDLDDGNGVPCLNENENSCPEHMVINKVTIGKEVTDISTSRTSLEKGNVLLEVSESKSKKWPRRKRSLADIIASQTRHPKSSNKQTEESKQLPQKYHKKDPKDKVKMSAKPATIEFETNDISEVNIQPAKNNAILEELTPKKLKVTKKDHGSGIQSLNTHSTLSAKNSSTPSLSEAGTDALQLTQGTTHLASISRDKALQNNLLDTEDGQTRQELAEMENEMAKNQHELGLSSPKHFDRNHDLHKDGRRLKRKKTDLTDVNKNVEEGGTGLKLDTVTAPKSKVGVTLEPSILRTSSPFRGPGPGKRTKRGLPCTNGDKGNLQSFSTFPSASHSTEVPKSSSSTKGLRS